MRKEELAHLADITNGENFQIEAIRNRDELIIRVVSIGQKKISAEMALDLVQDFSRSISSKFCFLEKKLALWSLLDLKLRDFEEFTSRHRSFFERCNLVYLGELAQFNQGFLKNKKVGKKSEEELKQFLKTRNLGFGMDRRKELFSWTIPDKR